MIANEHFALLCVVAARWLAAGMAVEDCEQVIYLELRREELDKSSAARIAAEVMSELRGGLVNVAGEL